MKKTHTLLNKLKFISLSIIIVNIISCTPEDDVNCETETVCYGDGNCIEKPIAGTCF